MQNSRRFRKKRSSSGSARRCDTAYFIGDFEAAKQHAPKADEDFYREFAAVLKEGFRRRQEQCPFRSGAD
jgi:hypothetical protein